MRKHLNDKELAANFDLDFHFAHVDTIFRRVFGRRWREPLVKRWPAACRPGIAGCRFLVSCVGRWPRQETILVFDSGLGGLTVYREIVAALPNADFVYAADDAAFPYGALEEPALIARVVTVIGELIVAERPISSWSRVTPLPQSH